MESAGAVLKRTWEDNEDALATDVAHFRPDAASFPQLPSGHFTMLGKISSGITGDVMRCRDKSDESFAVKKVRNQELARLEGTETNERSIFLRLSKKRSPSQEDALTEIGILRYLKQQSDCPLYLLKLGGVFTEGAGASGFTWVVTEDCEGGELFSEVSSGGALSQERAQKVSWQLMQAVAYLHQHFIGHRDISLENVLLKDGDVRLMDFGAAVQSHSSTGLPMRYFRTVGKDFYRAPEAWVPEAAQIDLVVPATAEPDQIIQTVVRKSYLSQVRLPSNIVPGRFCRADVVGYEATPCDVFSCGISLFIMLYGCPIFNAANLNDGVFAYVHAHGIAQLIEDWGMPAPAPEVLELLKGMLCVDPTQRWSAERCLGSAWLDGERKFEVPRHASQAVAAPAPNCVRGGA